MDGLAPGPLTPQKQTSAVTGGEGESQGPKRGPVHSGGLPCGSRGQGDTVGRSELDSTQPEGPGRQRRPVGKAPGGLFQFRRKKGFLTINAVQQ